MAIIKFHKKAIALLGLAQNSEGNFVIKNAPTGTITVGTGANTITGVGTKFSFGTASGDGLGELTVGAYIYKRDSAIATFTALTNGQTLTIAGLTWTAGGSGTSISQLATAFESISEGTAFGALSGRTGGGSFTAGTLTGFYTEAAISNTVEFSPKTVSYSASTIAVGGTGTAPTFTIHDGEVIGQIDTIVSQTSATLTENGAAALTAEGFRVGLGPKNALATLNLNFSTELTTESYQYTGNELDRDEQTVVTDTFAKFDFETFLPALGSIAGSDPTVDEIPYPDWFQAAGLGIILSGDNSGKVTYTNSVPSNVYMTVEIRRSSSDYTKQKVFQVENMRGNVDLSIPQTGSRTKLKWNFQGNLVGVFDKTRIDPNFLDQKSELSPTISSSSVTSSQLGLYNVDVAPTFTPGTKNICFQKLEAPNVSGFEYNRYQTSCLNGWSKGAVPTDVTLTILEDRAEATYNPDNHTQENHSLFLAYGSQTGYKVQLDFNKIQLAKVTNTTVADYTGQDLNFRNVGLTNITLS